MNMTKHVVFWSYTPTHRVQKFNTAGSEASFRKIPVTWNNQHQH